MADARGSIIAVMNSSGTVTNKNTYDPYGDPSSGNAGRFQYTGQIWLAEAGLYYYKARYYDPEVGRFLQTDPVGYRDQMNLYAYVGNDPVNGIDPTGECQVRDDGSEVGLCGNDDTGKSYVEAQLNDKDSSASDVEARLVRSGQRVGVTSTEGSGESQFDPDTKTITVGPETQVVENDDGTVSDIDAPVDEVLEHEVTHVNDWLNGGPLPYNTEVDASGITENPWEASAIDHTNDYRKAKGRGYQRLCHGCTVSEARKALDERKKGN